MDKNKLKDSAIIGVSAAVGSGVSSYVTAELLAREEVEAEAAESDDAGSKEPAAHPAAHVDAANAVNAANAANATVEPSSEAEVNVLTVEPVGPAESTEPVSPAEPAVASVHPEVPVGGQGNENEDLISEIEVMYGGPEVMYGGPEIDGNQINIEIEPDIYGGPVDNICPLDEDNIYS